MAMEAAVFLLSEKYSVIFNVVAYIVLALKKYTIYCSFCWIMV